MPSCAGCRHYLRPTVAKKAGRKPPSGHCALDRFLAHPTYCCARYQPSVDTLCNSVGLHTDERTTLRSTPNAERLRVLWAAFWVQPNNHKARAAFVAELRRLRAFASQETEMFAGNIPGTDERQKHGPDQSDRYPKP